VVLLPGADGATTLATEAAVKSFVADAFAHCKFIGYAATALPWFEAAGIADSLDGGCIELTGAGDVEAFLAACDALRFWAREPEVITV
jgi:catalase